MPGKSPTRRVPEAVPRAECERRALDALSPTRAMNAATIAGHIWPEHSMTAQGAALAAGGILGRMRSRGLVERYRSGWIRT